MKTITQILRFRESMVKYCEKHGVSETARKYKASRPTVYRWKKLYDGTQDSLRDFSHKPKSHPNQHTEEELKLIHNMRKRNPHAGLVESMKVFL